MIQLHDPPRNFIATVDSMNLALLRVRLEDLNGRREANLFLSTYGLPREETAAFQGRWPRELERLFNA